MLQILSQSLVGEDKLLNRSVLLTCFHVCHLVAVHHALEHFDLLAEGWLICALGGKCFESIVLLAESLEFNSLFFNDTLQLLTYGLELGSSPRLLGSQLNCVTWLST